MYLFAGLAAALAGAWYSRCPGVPVCPGRGSPAGTPAAEWCVGGLRSLSLFPSMANLLTRLVQGGESGVFVCGVFRWFLKKNNLKYYWWSSVSFVQRQILGVGMTLGVVPMEGVDCAPLGPPHSFTDVAS